VVLLQGRVPAGGQAPWWGAVGHPFAAQMGGMVQCGKHAMGEINQTGRSRRAGSGIMTQTIRTHRESVSPAHAAPAGVTVRAGRQRMW
jgi:hypothetical protein